MNEEELKSLWQADQAAPTIDFAKLQKSLSVWHDKLRRKVKIEIWLQGATVVLTFIPVFFYPKLIFFALFIAVLGVWYIPELRKLYQRENDKKGDVKNSLSMKILTMQRYFRRTRIVMYVFTPLAIPAVFYGLGFFDKPSATFSDLMFSLIKPLIIYEVLTIIATEIYFAILYTPALNELKNLLRQLDFNEN